METLHGSLDSPLLQGISNLAFENTPVVEGFDSEEVDQREEFVDFVLTVAKLSKSRRPSEVRDVHRCSSKTPAMIAFKLETGLRALCSPVLDCMCFI